MEESPRSKGRQVAIDDEEDFIPVDEAVTRSVAMPVDLSEEDFIPRDEAVTRSVAMPVDLSEEPYRGEANFSNQTGQRKKSGRALKNKSKLPGVCEEAEDREGIDEHDGEFAHKTGDRSPMKLKVKNTFLEVEVDEAGSGLAEDVSRAYKSAPPPPRQAAVEAEIDASPPKSPEMSSSRSSQEVKFSDDIDGEEPYRGEANFSNQTGQRKKSGRALKNKSKLPGVCEEAEDREGIDEHDGEFAHKTGDRSPMKLKVKNTFLEVEVDEAGSGLAEDVSRAYKSAPPPPRLAAVETEIDGPMILDFQHEEPYAREAYLRPPPGLADTEAPPGLADPEDATDVPGTPPPLSPKYSENVPTYPFLDPISNDFLLYRSDQVQPHQAAEVTQAIHAIHAAEEARLTAMAHMMYLQQVDISSQGMHHGGWDPAVPWNPVQPDYQPPIPPPLEEPSVSLNSLKSADDGEPPSHSPGKANEVAEAEEEIPPIPDQVYKEAAHREPARKITEFGVQWCVYARFLDSKDKEKVLNSETLEVPGKGKCQITCVLHSKETSAHRHCGSFKKAKGHGTLSVKTKDAIDFGFKVTLGEDTNMKQEVKVEHHDFGKNQGCCLLPPPCLESEGQEPPTDWDFASARNPQTGSFTIKLEVLPDLVGRKLPMESTDSTRVPSDD